MTTITIGRGHNAVTLTRGEFIEALERGIDTFTLRGVIDMLSQVCSEKEQHVASNWQDGELAKAWRKAELMFDRMAGKVLPR